MKNMPTILCLLLGLSLHAGESKKLKEDFLNGALAGINEIVFAVRARGAGTHWYDNMGRCFGGQYNLTSDLRKQVYRKDVDVPGGCSGWLYGHGPARLSAVNIRTGNVRDLLSTADGGVRDPRVSYDGRKILFSYRKTGSPRYHLYEINADGSGLKQLTDGDYDDIEPIYLPNGDIVFNSTRGNRFTPCNANEAAILYRCKADGSDIHCISLNQEFDNTPWVMQDGRIAYLRWEYVSRDLYKLHNLWAFNPDGTNVTVLWGNSREASGGATLDAKPVPGTNSLILSHSPRHGVLEHMGKIRILDPKTGPDDREAMRTISPGRGGPDHPKTGGISGGKSEIWRDPWAFSETAFMAASWKSIYLMDDNGNYQALHTIKETDPNVWLHEPRPLVARPKEPIIPDRVDRTKKTGTMILASAHVSRSTDVVKPGDVKALLITEVIPLAVTNKTPEPMSLGSTYFPMRTLGTVPVEADGSAHFDVPAGRAITIATLDKDGVEIQRMLSFTGVMPGETISCVGCHERRTRTPEPRPQIALLATKRPASAIEPLKGVSGTIDYRRDIQPIFDAKCVSCHNSKNYGTSKLILGGWRFRRFTASYTNLIKRRFVWSGGGGEMGARAPYRMSGGSKLIQMTKGKHHGVKLDEEERNLIRAWAASNVPFSGTLAIIHGQRWAPVPRIDKNILKNRCDTCHQKQRKSWSKKPQLPLVQTRAIYKLDNHVYMADPTDPENSVILRAPLAKDAGGLELCGKAVFKNTDDADYQALLKSIRKTADSIKRNPPPLEPSLAPQYIQEMKRIGALTEENKDDPYAIDAKYLEDLYKQYRE